MQFLRRKEKKLTVTEPVKNRKITQVWIQKGVIPRTHKGGPVVVRVPKVANRGPQTKGGSLTADV